MSGVLIETSVQSGLVRVDRLTNGVAILRLGSADERVVTLDVPRMEALKRQLQDLRSMRPKGLVIAGSGEEMFTAGADISLIRQVTDVETGANLARAGQELFDLISGLGCITVAAISGACVGGGCELALACDYRVISDHKRSVIGLPEVKLGILPGFGGTQRLPRLIGLPLALDVILAGKTLKPKAALSVGMVDKIIPFAQIESIAIEIASGQLKLKSNKPKFMASLLTYTGIGRRIVKKKALATIKRQSKGFYPAPPAALDACIYGLENGITAGLRNEAQELGRLIVTPECKSLVNVFYLTEAAKNLGKAGRKDAQNIYGLVVGAGAMGAGIASLLARNESQVILKDRTETDLDRGIEQIKSELSKSRSLSDQDRSFILNRIERTTKDSPNLPQVNFAIEAVYEDLKLKQEILGQLSSKLRADAIIATNTSSLSVSEISKVIENPERCVGVHFFNPVLKMPLVEIVRGDKTSDKIALTIAALVVKMNKFPIIVADVPGFLVNRILSPYLNEAAYLLQDGFSINDIDKAALDFGMPMGPLRLLDEVGLDVAGHVADSMFAGYGDRMKSPPFAKQLADLGRKGKKSKAGFYDFVDGQRETPNPEIRRMLNLGEAKREVDLRTIATRLIMSLVNEAVRCLDQDVAGNPGPEAAQQVDLGSIMGFGFPPFRGGVLHYADSLGARSVLETLEKLESECGMRFRPSEGVKIRAQTSKSFKQMM